MKILFPYMARWHAVNWTRYHSLLSALAEKGHEIHVLQPPSLVSSETNFIEIDAFEQKNLFITDVPVANFIWRTKLPLDKLFKKAFYSISAYFYCKKYMKHNAIDVVLLYNIPQYQFIRLKNTKMIFDFADDYVDMLKKELGFLSNPLVLGLAQWLLNNMIKRSDITLSVSHELGELVNGNVHVLPNGVNEKLPQNDKNLAIRIHNNEKPIVGFLGSFEYFIDFDLILQAAKRLPNVHFLLVGSGRDWEKVKTKIIDENINNVELTGGVPHSLVFRYIEAMDICMNVFLPIPVSHRACPIKLFEYLSLHKPVISTRLDELKHIDRDFLYYADTSDELAAQIKTILNNPEEAMKKAEIGYKITMENYTWERLADQFTQMVEEIDK